MSKVTQDVVLLPEEKRHVDEEAGGTGSEVPEAEETQSQRNRKTKRFILGFLLAIAIVLLIVGLSVGLTQRNKEPSGEGEPADTTTNILSSNPNESIFDEAVSLLESTPRQSRELPNGETISFREFNKGQPHILVALPGYGADDSSYSILAVMPQLQDHHIIAVNPKGWNGSTMNTPVYSHEENAVEVMSLLQVLGVEKAMVIGYSTGGGIAFYLAQKYPETILAAFLLHSIPLDGYRMTTVDGQGFAQNMDEVKIIAKAGMLPDDPDIIYEMFKSFSTNPDGFVPKDHLLTEYFTEAAVKMPGKFEALVANVSFNVTPIKTAFALPSDALSKLESKIIVIHGSKDEVVSSQQVESVTKLAIAEQWAPPGMLSFYEDGEGHMVLMDKPEVVAKTYRKALEEQVLTTDT